MKKAFQQILMKTVGQHDFSMQECAHILNGFDFVEMSLECAGVNVMGTRRLRAPEANDTDKTDLAKSSIATVYWNQENDNAYKEAIGLFQRHPDVVRNHAEESLYNFAMLYMIKWNLRPKQQNMVPHVTLSFKKIPKAGGQNKEIYQMFLGSILLVHKPGTTFQTISEMSQSQLEAEVSEFDMSETCPKLVSEKI